MNKEIDKSFLVRLAAGRCSEEEHTLFIYRLRNADPAVRRKVIDDFERILSESGEIPDTPIIVKERMRAMLRGKVDPNVVRMKGYAMVRSVMRYAAVLVMVLLGGWWSYNSLRKSHPKYEWQQRSALNGQKLKLQLPDGSTILMNSGSTIRFPKKFDEEKREIFLTGEAFFEVVKKEKQPFIVRTSALNTQVLGTSFNVCAFPEASSKVTVITGKVKVSKSAGSESVILLPREELTLDTPSGQLRKEAAHDDGSLYWKDGVLLLDGKLGEMIPRIERWYNIEISLSESRLKDCMIQAKYNNEPLKNVLESMRYFLNVDYHIATDTVHINGAGCN